MTYINIVQLFEAFANAHVGVQRFKSDTLDRMDDFTNNDESFPLMYAVMNNISKRKTTSDYNADVFSFNIYCLVPRIDVDLSEDNVTILNQTNRNISTCSSILSDLVNWIDTLELNNIYLDYSIISLPVNNITKDRLQGVYVTVQVEVLDMNNCYIPFDELPDINTPTCNASLAPVCQPVTVIDSDGTTEFKIASGGEFTCTPAPTPIVLENNSTLDNFNVYNYQPGAGPKGSDIYEFEFTISTNSGVFEDGLLLMITNIENGFNMNPSNDGAPGNTYIRTIAINGAEGSSQNFYFGAFYTHTPADYIIETQMVDTINQITSGINTFTITLNG